MKLAIKIFLLGFTQAIHTYKDEQQAQQLAESDSDAERYMKRHDRTIEMDLLSEPNHSKSSKSVSSKSKS
jgi:hypothetical protein